MSKEDLEKLRRELQSLAAEYRGRRTGPNSLELQYNMMRLTTALTGFIQLGYFSNFPLHEPAEVLAQLDSLLARTDEIRDLVERVREILLRPPPEETSPGFTEGE
jgi:hypothetical protein